MKRSNFIRRLAWPLLLFTAAAGAQTTFITDKISVELYSSAVEKGAPVATVKTGAIVDVIASEGDYSKVRTQAGQEGWLHNHYLSSEKPAQVSYLQLMAKHQQLQEELGRLKNQAGISAEVEKEKAVLAKIRNDLSEAKKTIGGLENELKEKTAALDDARRQLAGPSPAPATEPAATSDAPFIKTSLPAGPPLNLDYPVGLKWLLAVMLLSVLSGGYLGYSWLDRKIARRHGGIRIR